MYLLYKKSLCLAILLFFSIGKVSAQNNDYQVAGLNEHNKLRKLHGAPAMTLDSNLNTIAINCAQHYANKGTIDHSCPHKNKMNHGENLSYAMNSRGVNEKQGVLAGIKSWYDEVKQYNFNNPGFTMATGHFTQLVWKASTKLGIGAAIKGNQVFVAAIYSPPGNFNNDYRNQVMPRQM